MMNADEICMILDLMDDLVAWLGLESTVNVDANRDARLLAYTARWARSRGAVAPSAACQKMVDGDFSTLCVLPKGHAGDHRDPDVTP